MAELTSEQEDEAADDYAAELRRWRELRGLSKQALAKQMAYDRSYVSHIENGNLQPTEDFTRRAEQVLATQGALWSAWESLALARSRHDRLAASPVETTALRTASLVSWIADRSDWSFQEAYDFVRSFATQLEAEPPALGYARAHARSRVTRQDVADALIEFYGAGETHGRDDLRFYRPRIGGTRDLALSILTSPSWLHLVVELGTSAEHFTFTPPTETAHVPLSPVAVRAALQRLAEVETAETVLVNNPLYRLLEVKVQLDRIDASFTAVDFLTYALSGDLLEAELINVLVQPAERNNRSLAERLPLRGLYLPTVAAALDLQARTCVGGPAALLAIARRASTRNARDYVLLVQERSPRVLNVTGKLAVIPKAFHQPTAEQAAEVALSATLARELEEELLGRQDLEGLGDDSQRQADPLHWGSQTQAMSWLQERQAAGSYSVECVGFGINMVTGNYEFPCLIAIDDEEWWDRYGHQVEANWETLRIRRYSSLDTAGLAALAVDPTWSNEGLFAFLEGLRRLAATDTAGRVAAPAIEVES